MLCPFNVTYSQVDAGPAAPPSDTELRGSGSTPATSTNQPIATGMPPTVPSTTTTNTDDTSSNPPPMVSPDQNKYSRRVKKSSKAMNTNLRVCI